LEKQKLNTTLIYVLSILGFLCCCFFGLGIIPSGIAFFISNKQLKEAYADHENYENIEAMKTAKIVALVVFIINILMVLRVIFVLSTVGYDGIIEQINEAMEQARQNQ
jgi:uncharacterized membrane protein YqhA